MSRPCPCINSVQHQQWQLSRQMPFNRSGCTHTQGQIAVECVGCTHFRDIHVSCPHPPSAFMCGTFMDCYLLRRVFLSTYPASMYRVETFLEDAPFCFLLHSHLFSLALCSLLLQTFLWVFFLLKYLLHLVMPEACASMSKRLRSSVSIP